MKNLKFWGLAILTTALIFGVFYGMLHVIDEKLRAQFPETMETVTEAETDPIEFETIETESETDADTICEDTDVALSSDVQEIQSLLSSVSEPAHEADTEGTVLESSNNQVNEVNDGANCEALRGFDEVGNQANEDDVMLLARLIMNEAGYDFCTDAHQRAVASVLLNHVASPSHDFPDTVYGCIFSGWVDGGIKHYGIGSYAEFMAIVPSERAIANAQYVMTYGSTVGDAIYQAEFIPDGHEVVAVFDYGVGLPTYICR